MEAEDGLHALEHPGLDQGGGAAGHGLLGGLEDQPHGPLESLVSSQGREGQAGAQGDHRVQVVAAGVAEPFDRGPVGHVLGVVQPERVDVAPDGHHRSARAHVAHHAGAGGAHAGVETRLEQALLEHPGGAVLLPRGLGVGVEVSAEGDQLALQGRHHLGDAGGAATTAAVGPASTRLMRRARR